MSDTTTAPSRALGARVAAARGYRRISQRELARRVGVSANAIWNLEHDENQARGPSVFLLQSIAYELGISADYLLGLSPVMEPTNGRRSPC